MALLTFLSFIFFSLFLQQPTAARTCSTSCPGGGPEVKFPFGLNPNGSRNGRCSYPGFGLSCDNKKEELVLNLPESGEFIVRYIDYEAQQIWISDPDSCLPKRFLQSFNVSGTPFDSEFWYPFTFFNCSAIEAAEAGLRPIPCLSNQNYTVVASQTNSFVGSSSVLQSACRPITTFTVPFVWYGWWDGVRLEWNQPDCRSCVERRGDCRFRNRTSLEIGCFNLPSKEEGKAASDGKPSIGPVYRSSFAEDGFPAPIPGMESCWDIFRMSVEKYPDNPMLGRRQIVNGKAGKYVWQSYREVYDIVIKVGNSIRSCGVEEGGKCGIYGANCPEWIMSMEACNAHGLYCVPLYDTLGAGAVEFIICHAEVSIAFVEEKKINELFKTFPNSTKYLRTIVSFGNVTPDQKAEAEKYGLAVYPWEEFLQLGENKQFDLPVKKKSDICTIMYTSGTTGDPKGVMISNDSIVTLIAGVKRLLERVNEHLTVKDVYISYLPLAHIFDRVIEELFISHGASIGFWRGDVKLLVEDIGELKPSIFCAVPRVLDRIYSGLLQKISGGGLLKKTIFDVAYSYKFYNMKKGHKHTEASMICDKVVFSKVKQGLGGNVRLILSGAAPLSAHVEEFLRVVACCHVLQGYGLTESCAGTFVSLPNELSMLGTVGPPVPNVDICLESVPEMGYDALGSTPRGEICIRGNTIFSGYYKCEDLTDEVLIDGWLHTGDIGEWQPNGSMKIIDRKKNIFKLSQGEYVAVENLENVYGLVSDIDSIWIYGNSFESFLVAVVNPNKQALESWAAENGVSGDFDSICQNPKAKEYILGELFKIGKEKKLKGFEFIKAVHLDPVPFDMERDLLTPTFKKKRPQLLKYYQSVIDNMYKSVNKPNA